MKKLLAASAALALPFCLPATAQEAPEGAPSPNEIVAQASDSEWVAIAPEDLLVMTLAPDADGNERRVVIQLMPPPFSQGWVDNIRTLARAGWYDGVSVNRVQDNYVVQWGDPADPDAGETPKPLPEGLKVMGEEEYIVDVDTLSEHTGSDDWMASQEVDAEKEVKLDALFRIAGDPTKSEAEHDAAIAEALRLVGLAPSGQSNDMSASEKIAMISITSTQTPRAPEGWHDRDSYAEWVEIWKGWPLANVEVKTWEDEDGNTVPDPMSPTHEARAQGIYDNVTESWFWPTHCYGMVGVGRNYSPDTGTGAELYTVIGHAPRHLDRNIALVGRVIEGIEHLSSLPRGKGPLGFYLNASKRVPILSVRVASDLPEGERPAFQYLNTSGQTFARYVDARANRRDPFFIKPAGGADICNLPVPIRKVGE